MFLLIVLKELVFWWDIWQKKLKSKVSKGEGSGFDGQNGIRLGSWLVFVTFL